MAIIRRTTQLKISLLLQCLHGIKDADMVKLKYLLRNAFDNAIAIQRNSKKSYLVHSVLDPFTARLVSLVSNLKISSRLSITFSVVVDNN